MIVRRILEPFFLGAVSNLAVNFIFNPYSYGLHLDEFITACVLCIPITELNRYIDQKLEQKFNWIEYPQQRFTAHLFLISLGLLISLNILGNAYMWITGKGFFSWKELSIINLVTLCLAILLTILNWSVQFYFRWKNAEANTSGAFRLVHDLREKITRENQLIELQKGTSRIKVESKTIRMATIEFGTVRVYSDKDQCSIFTGSLSQLYSQLPDHLYFQVTRDAILHRDVIKTISPSTFGKIHLTIQETNATPSTYTVSRPRASAFRKWYNSNSV